MTADERLARLEERFISLDDHIRKSLDDTRAHNARQTDMLVKQGTAIAEMRVEIRNARDMKQRLTHRVNIHGRALDDIMPRLKSAEDKAEAALQLHSDNRTERSQDRRAFLVLSVTTLIAIAGMALDWFSKRFGG